HASRILVERSMPVLRRRPLDAGTPDDRSPLSACLYSRPRLVINIAFHMFPCRLVAGRGTARLLVSLVWPTDRRDAGHVGLFVAVRNAARGGVRRGPDRPPPRAPDSRNGVADRLR